MVIICKLERLLLANQRMKAMLSRDLDMWLRFSSAFFFLRDDFAAAEIRQLSRGCLKKRKGLGTLDLGLEGHILTQFWHER